jgi:phage terminase small subunit
MVSRSDRWAHSFEGKPATKLPKSEHKRKTGPKVKLEEKRLTRKQELFVKELVSKDGMITMREAATNAGFAEKSAHVRASELTNPRLYPHVVRAIKEYRAELDQKFGVEYQRHIRDLQIIRDQALENQSYSAAVQAEKARGLASGNIYVHKSEIRHGTIESMSKDEVLSALKEIKDSYAPITFQSDTGRKRSKARERLLDETEDSIEETELADDSN